MSEHAAPCWPSGNGRRVFACLRASDIDQILSALSASRALVIAAISETTIEELRCFERSGMVITDRHVDLVRAAESCDAFVNHSSHGFVAEMLLAGKPGVLPPLFHEHLLTERRVVELDAGVTPPTRQPNNVAAAIERVLDDNSLRSGPRGSPPAGVTSAAIASSATCLTPSSRHRLSLFCWGFWVLGVTPGG
jgi:hypothetical protein